MLRQMGLWSGQLVPELPQMAVEIILSTSDKKKYFLGIPRNRLEEMIILKYFEYSEEPEIYFLEKVKEEICLAQIEKSGRISRVESTYKVVSTKTVYPTNKLTSQNISKGFIIYERLSI